MRINKIITTILCAILTVFTTSCTNKSDKLNITIYPKEIQSTYISDCADLIFVQANDMVYMIKKKQIAENNGDNSALIYNQVSEVPELAEVNQFVDGSKYPIFIMETGNIKYIQYISKQYSDGTGYYPYLEYPTDGVKTLATDFSCAKLAINNNGDYAENKLKDYCFFLDTQGGVWYSLIDENGFEKPTSIKISENKIVDITSDADGFYFLSENGDLFFLKLDNLKETKKIYSNSKIKNVYAYSNDIFLTTSDNQLCRGKYEQKTNKFKVSDKIDFQSLVKSVKFSKDTTGEGYCKYNVIVYLENDALINGVVGKENNALSIDSKDKFFDGNGNILRFDQQSNTTFAYMKDGTINVWGCYPYPNTEIDDDSINSQFNYEMPTKVNDIEIVDGYIWR